MPVRALAGWASVLTAVFWAVVFCAVVFCAVVFCAVVFRAAVFWAVLAESALPDVLAVAVRSGLAVTFTEPVALLPGAAVVAGELAEAGL